MLNILKLHNLKFEYFNNSKIKNKAYQKVLHVLRFSKHYSLQNLAKPTQSYKGFCGRDLLVRLGTCP